MKLLLDHSLAPRIAPALADLFPGSIHARDAGLARAEDADLWLHARDRAYTLVSKAPDFNQRAMLLGQPPKVIWLRGRLPTAQLVESLRAAAADLHRFHADPDRCLLVISPHPER